MAVRTADERRASGFCIRAGDIVLEAPLKTENDHIVLARTAA
jgi:hypothetical protein